MNLDNTVAIFNNFYNVNLVVSANEYDLVYSFFAEYTKNTNIAKTFTEILFRVSSETDTNVLQLLDQFRGTDSMKIALTLAYYLNTLSENKTVLYGVNNVIVPNEKVQRNIIQDNPVAG
jgi:hypothetical protein